MATNNSTYPFNVYWSIPECSIEAQTVRDLLVSHGFAENEIPEPNMRKNTARCVKSFHHLRGSNKTLADAAGETEEQAVYSLLDRSSGSTDTAVSYDEDTRIVFDKNTNTVSATGSFANEFFDRLNNQYVGRYQADDFRAWILTLVARCAGVPKRPTGGIYIVPGRFRTVFEQAREFLREAAKGADIYIERVFMGDEETENIRMSVNDFVTRRLDALSERATEYERQSAIGHLQDATNRLSEINALFSEALDIQALADDVASRVNGIGDTLNDAMANIASEREKRKAAGRAVADPAASPSKTPAEVAQKVVEVLETMENGTADAETIGVILKAEGFVGKPSTVMRRVQKAVEDGFRGLVITSNGFTLAASATPPAEQVNAAPVEVAAEVAAEVAESEDAPRQ